MAKGELKPSVIPQTFDQALAQEAKVKKPRPKKTKEQREMEKALSDASPIFMAAGILRPEREYRFDAERQWRFDYAWPERRIALEVEGGVWTQGRHTRGKGFLEDMKKYNRAAMLGWRVVRCVPDTLTSGETIQMLLGLALDQ